MTKYKKITLIILVNVIVFIGLLGLFFSNAFTVEQQDHIQWEYNVSIHSIISHLNPVVSDDGPICSEIGQEFATPSNKRDKLIALNPDGTLKWEYKFVGDKYVRSSTVVGDSVVYSFHLTSNIEHAAKHNLTNDAKQCLNATELNTFNIAPSNLITLWGDSQSDVLGDNFSTDKAIERSIGGETTTEILNRVIGYLPNIADRAWSYRNVRLQARRAVPNRTVTEDYRSSWERYGQTVNEPEYISFFNNGQLIGNSAERYRVHAYINNGVKLMPAGPMFKDGDQVIVKDQAKPENMYAWKVYFVRDANVGSNYFSLSETNGGKAINFAGFKGYVELFGDFYMDWIYDGTNHKITTSSTAKSDLNIQHFSGGTNNITDVEQIKADIAKMVELHSDGRFIISNISGFYGSVWQFGGDKYNDMVDVNAWILATYPDNNIDIYGYLLTQGDGSADDIADVAVGLLPRSLRIEDGGHLNAAGSALWAAKVNEFIATKGWQ